MTILQTEVVVLGAGAAGMMCTATALARGRQVVLIDHAQKLAEKIRISGGGRCNFTNLDVSAANYLSDNPHFCRSALAGYQPKDFIALLEQHGLHYHEKTLGQLFCDEGSQAIITLLKDLCAEATWRMQTSVLSVTAHENGGYLVRTSQESWHCQSLVIATGGLSIPQIGATGLGYDIARQFAIPVITPTAALVPLTLEHTHTELAGVSLPDVIIRCKKQSFREAILFTHRGISGPAVLQISSYWQPGDTLHIDLLPEQHDPMALFVQRDAHVSTLLTHHLPKRFVQAIWPDTQKPVKQYSPKALNALAAQLKDWQLTPTGSLGFKKAEVTAGGVDTRALSSKTMEVNTMPGLYFIGEVVDVTGWLGGYNFQWAWASAHAAGKVC